MNELKGSGAALWSARRCGQRARSFSDHANRLVYLDQGWGPAETLWYYHADQGSMLLPRDVLVNLEQPGSQSRIIDPVNLARFRFLNQQKTPNNPDALPVGLARHQDHRPDLRAPATPGRLSTAARRCASMACASAG